MASIDSSASSSPRPSRAFPWLALGMLALFFAATAALLVWGGAH